MKIELISVEQFNIIPENDADAAILRLWVRSEMFVPSSYMHREEIVDSLKVSVRGMPIVKTEEPKKPKEAESPEVIKWREAFLSELSTITFSEDKSTDTSIRGAIARQSLHVKDVSSKAFGRPDGYPSFYQWAKAMVGSNGSIGYVGPFRKPIMIEALREYVNQYEMKSPTIMRVNWGMKETDFTLESIEVEKDTSTYRIVVRANNGRLQEIASEAKEIKAAFYRGDWGDRTSFEIVSVNVNEIVLKEMQGNGGNSN